MKLNQTAFALLVGASACVLLVRFCPVNSNSNIENTDTLQESDTEKSRNETPPPSLTSSTREILESPRRHSIATANHPIPPEIPTDPDEARGWALNNLESAFHWLASAPPGPQRDIVVETLACETAQYLPEEAIALAQRYNHGNYYLMETLLQQWAEKNERAAETYALEFPPSEMRNRLVSRIAFTRSKNDPARAAALVIEQIEPGAIQDEALITVLYQWTKQDFESAQDWVESIPQSRFRDRAVNEITGAMAYSEDQPPK